MESSLNCPICSLSFTTEADLHTHQINSDGHWYCPACEDYCQGRDDCLQHIRVIHPHRQYLLCPGECGQVFERVAKLIDHIESYPCVGMRDSLKERELARSVQRNAFAADDDLDGSAWDCLTDSLKTKSRHQSPSDPDSILFNPDKYYIALIKQWRCPHAACRGKTFKQLGAFKSHLSSSAHKTTSKSRREIRCPICHKLFTTATDMAQHVEQEGGRCRVKESSEFDRIVSQMTGGYVETDGLHIDTTIKYKSVELLVGPDEEHTAIEKEIAITVNRILTEFIKADPNSFKRKGSRITERDMDTISQKMSEYGLNPPSKQFSAQLASWAQLADFEELEDGFGDATEFNEMKRLAASGLVSSSSTISASLSTTHAQASNRSSDSAVELSCSQRPSYASTLRATTAQTPTKVNQAFTRNKTKEGEMSVGVRKDYCQKSQENVKEDVRPQEKQNKGDAEEYDGW